MRRNSEGRLLADHDIPHLGVRRGDVGGWVTRRVRIYDDAWIAPGATVTGGVSLSGTAVIAEGARVSGTRRAPTSLSGDTLVAEHAVIGPGTAIDDSFIYGLSRINDAYITDSRIAGGDVNDAIISDSTISGAPIIRRAAVRDSAITGAARIFGLRSLPRLEVRAAAIDGPAFLRTPADLRVVDGVVEYRTVRGWRRASAV